MKKSGIKSQAQLAGQTGISVTQINNILRSEKGASVDLLQRLADGLECEPWVLLTPTTFLEANSNRDFFLFMHRYVRLNPSAQDAIWSITQDLYEATGKPLLF